MNDYITILETELKNNGYTAMIQHATFLVRCREITMADAMSYIQQIARAHPDLVLQEEEQDGA